MKKSTPNKQQLVHKQKTTSYISLPYQMVQDIKALNLSKQYTAYCYKFAGIIIRNNFFDSLDIYAETEIPAEYIRTAFNDKKYTLWLYPLLESEIIIRNDYYSELNNQCYKYSINSKYCGLNSYDNNIINPLVLCRDNTDNTSNDKGLQGIYDIEDDKSINLINPLVLCRDNMYKPLISLGYNDINVLNTKDRLYLKWYKEDMGELDIDYDKLNTIIQQRISEVHIDNFKINEQILDRNVMLKNQQGKPYFMNREKAIEKAKSLGKTLIKDGKRFVIDNLDVFFAKKKQSIYITYNDAIRNIKEGNLRASRNATNNRLDTNITNLCSDLTDAICDQNNLDQIDLNNSQFALLSHLLDSKLNTPDFSLFKQLTVSGKLYEYISDNLDLESRKLGKNAAFEILFSSRKNNTENKKKLKAIFPSVIKWIDDYKAANGDAAFSVSLQQKESLIFIDNLLTRIKKKKMFCLTKHDSLIVRHENLDEVLKMVTDYFAEIKLEYKLDIKKSSDLSNDNQPDDQEDITTEIVAEIEENEADFDTEEDIDTLINFVDEYNEGFQIRKGSNGKFMVIKIFVRRGLLKTRNQIINEFESRLSTVA